MGKKKKRNKGKGNKAGPFENLNVKQLVVKGGQLLSQGKTRDALSCLKKAENKAGRGPNTDALLFEAYIARQRELSEKGMLSEASAMKKQVSEYFPGLDRVDEPQMAQYVGCLDGDAPFSAYSRYLERRGPSPLIERVLVNKLVLEKGWKHASLLREETALKRDCEPVKNAVEMMDQGRWEDAAECLKTVSRNSPFAPLRMFCRAMTAFYSEDDKMAIRAIDMVPEDFCLKPVLDTLRSSLNGNPDRHAKRRAMGSLDFLWDGPVGAEKIAKDLLHDIANRPADQWGAKIKALADEIFPENPDAAVWEILHILGKIFASQGTFHRRTFQKAVGKIIDKNTQQLFETKFSYLFSDGKLRCAGAYLAALEKEFADQKERTIAGAMVLRGAVQGALKDPEESFHPYIFENGSLTRYLKHLGIESEDSEMAPIEMALKSISMDPDNREGYLLLSGIPRNSRMAKNAVENAFLAMMKKFPDDPFPCLELADLYYSKNAFRKAENVLKEAMKRAPHDNRVLDRHALAFVISADKNIKRSNYHLSWPDLESASKLGRPKLAALIAVKRTVYRIVAKEENMAEAFDAETKGFSQTERLRSMAMTLLDLRDLQSGPRDRRADEFKKLLLKETKTISRLSSSERVTLISPLDIHQGRLCPCDMGGTFLAYDKKLLKGVSDEDLPFAADMIFNRNHYQTIKSEMNRRKKKASHTHSLIFEFYVAVIDYITGERRSHVAFEDILEEASEGEVRKLKEAAQRLVPRVDGKLKTALGNFDFYMLESPYHRYDDDYDYFDDDFDDDDFDDDDFDDDDDDLDGDDLFDLFDDDLKGLRTLLVRVEGLLDELGIRRAPDRVVLAMREDMLKSPMSMELKMMSMTLLPLADEMSQKAQLFIFGKKLA